MDFITGALPNVMFIAGLIAMGLGLGIEFKIVEIKGELSKAGRLGAMATGAVLMIISIYLYTRPPQTVPLPRTVAGAPPAVAQANAGGTGSAPQAARVPMDATALAPKTATSAPPTVTVVSPTATPVPPRPTVVPPTATPMPPTATRLPPTARRPPTATAAPTAVPGVRVPDIRGQNVRDAQKTLVAAGLRLDERRERCADIGASDAGRKLKKGQIRCQSPAPGSVAAPNTLVLVVTENGGNPHD
jgi:PASTA domain